jgi:O-antigen ligase
MIKLPGFLKFSWNDITSVKMSRLFLGLFLFCLPFQIRSYIYGGSFFITGNFSPYTTFFVYFTDIFLLLSFLFWGVALFRGEIKNEIEIGQKTISAAIIAFLVVGLSGVFFSPDKNLSFLLSFRFILFFLLYILIVNGVLNRHEIIRFLLAGILLQAFIGIAQYFLQRSVGLSFFGESAIGPDVEGVAKMDWNGAKIVRAYGTFAHANIFGGALFIALIFSIYEFGDKLKFLLPIVAILIMALVFTFSRSAFFALIAAFLLYISINDSRTSLKYVIFGVSLLLFFIVVFDLESIFLQRFLFSGDVESGMERMQYFDISKNMLMSNPFGVGLGGFIPFMQNYSVAKLEPWVFQPVHNVVMLAANELGVIGVAIIIFLVGIIFYLLIKACCAGLIAGGKKRGFTALYDSDDQKFGYVLIAILGGIVTISLFDHYFFTIYQGQALFFIYLGLASGYLKKFAFPLKKS